MTQGANEAYLEAFSAEELEYFNNLPIWVVAAWALAVWSALLASVLLLFKKQFAITVFLFSLLSMIVSHSYTYVFSNGAEVMGGSSSLIMPTAILLLAIFFWRYAAFIVRPTV